jgi:hypothetical protein
MNKRRSGHVAAVEAAPADAGPFANTNFPKHRPKYTGDGGGAEGNRTPDLLIANEALSQLSYSPIAGHAASSILPVTPGAPNDR